MLFLQSFASFIIYPVGALFCYYLMMLLLITSLKGNFVNIIVSLIIWTLILMPIIWLLIAPEYLLFDLLMPKLDIDMK